MPSVACVSSAPPTAAAAAAAAAAAVSCADCRATTAPASASGSSLTPTSLALLAASLPGDSRLTTEPGASRCPDAAST